MKANKLPCHGGGCMHCTELGTDLRKKSELLSLRSHEGVCLSSGAPRKGVNMLYPAQTSGSWF